MRGQKRAVFVFLAACAVGTLLMVARQLLAAPEAATTESRPFFSARGQLTSFGSACHLQNNWATSIKTQTCSAATGPPKYRNNSIAQQEKLVLKRTEQCDCDSPAVDAGMCATVGKTHDVRCLPSFMIIGAMKCGTGELMKWLQLHPLLRVGRGVNGENEIHFFGAQAENAECAWKEYLTRFPKIESKEAKTLYTFEKSPDYMRSDSKLQQIKDMLPSVKLVMLLRNPTDRAYSGFGHNCRHKRYHRLLRHVSELGELGKKGAVISAEIRDGKLSLMGGGVTLGPGDFETLEYPCSEQDFAQYYLMNDESRPGQRKIRHVPELSYGHFDNQFESTIKLFPRENVLVLFQEDMFHDTLGTLQAVQQFVGMPCFDFSSIAEYWTEGGIPQRPTTTWSEWWDLWITNYAGHSRYKEAMTESTRAVLDEYFRSHNRNLQQLLGFKLPEKWPQ